MRFKALIIISIILNISSLAVSQVPNSTFKVGVFLCLSGECAEWGEASLKGLKLASQVIKNNGGILGKDIELIVEDSQEDEGPTPALTSFQRLLLNKEIKYFIGPTWTPAGLAIAPIAAKMKEVIITSPSLGVSDFNEAGDNLFNTWPHDEYATRYLARWAIKNNFKKIAIISSQQPWEFQQGRVFKDEIEKSGNVTPIILEPLPDQSDLRAEVTKIIHSSSDAIVITNLGKTDIIAKELQKQGFKGKKLSVLIDKFRLLSAGEALKGTVYLDQQPSSTDFVEAFKSEFSEEPGISAATAYDALLMYSEAIKKAGTEDPILVKNALLTVSIKGASGNLHYDPKGGVIREPLIAEVH